MAPVKARPKASEAPAVSAAAPHDASPSVALAPDAAPRTPMPEGPPGWRSVPREQGGFYAVLDGLCSQLAAGRVGKDVVVHYGGGNAGYYSNGLRIGAASFIALRDDGLESIGAPLIASPTGIAGKSLDDFWIADSTGSRSSEGAILHRHVDGKWKTYAKDQTNLHAWLDGGIIGSLGMAAAYGELWVEGSGTRPPAALTWGLRFPALAAFPTGDVIVAARRDWEGPLLARHWAPGKKISEYPLERLLPLAADAEWTWLHEVAPDEVYAVRGERTARWDGASWRGLARTLGGEKIKELRRVAPDELWALTEASTLQRITGAAAARIATPEPVVDLDGVEQGGAWIVGRSGKLFRREGEGWRAVPLPAPVFSVGAALKAKRVLVAAPDDALIIGMYWEKGPGWKEQELHTALFRTRPVKETLRCNEPDPENNNVHLGRGFQSWPPMATAECKAPFAVLARRSNALPRDDDWPRIRGALKGHTELGEVSLVEFVSGDRKFVGAKAKDLEAARKIAELVAKGDRLRPEVVCGQPEPRRTLALDLATGVATVR